MSEQTSKVRRCPLWLRIVLGLSLAVNLAVAGLVVGTVMGGGPMGGKGPAFGYAVPYVIALERDQRREIFRTVRDDDTLPNRRARRMIYDEMMTALAADPFDRAAVADILRRQSAAAADVQSVAQSQWMDLVADMSTEARVAYVGRITEVLNRGHKRGGERKPK